MLRITIVSALLMSASTAIAQLHGGLAYHPALPPPSTYTAYGAYGGYYGGTVAGSAMQGMASVISAKGDYNLSTSAAAINAAQAQRLEIENRQIWTNTYFEMRAAQRAAVAAERGPPPTQEQLVRLAADGVPKPLGSHELDAVSGQVYWPDLLQDNQFSEMRAEIERLLARRAEYGRLGISDRNQVGQMIEIILERLQAHIRNVEPQQYMASRIFLRSLLYNVTGTQL